MFCGGLINSRNEFKEKYFFNHWYVKSANVQCPIGKILVVLNVKINVKMLLFCLKNTIILCTDLELGYTSHRDEGRTEQIYF